MLVGAFYTSKAQQQTNRKGSQIVLTPLKEIAATPIKDQSQSGTCWSFSTESFLESELIRMGKEAVDLSEMYIVRKAYEQKAWRYVRMLGRAQFGPGGEPHDVMNIIRAFGIVPESAYPGTLMGEKINHNEMDAVLKAYLDEVVKLQQNGHTSKFWFEGYKGILDAYLGKVPEEFVYNGKTYNPKSFQAYLGIHPDDYIELTSFTHHPLYSQFVLEVADNWSTELIYNISLEDLGTIADAALNAGYGIEWASDVSERGFDFKKGLAIVPFKPWAEMNEKDKDSIFTWPTLEPEVTAAMRQEAFDNLSTQDDHGMHFTGIYKDQTGKIYYRVKNSWGAKSNDCEGSFYCTKNYYLYKTTAILLHRKAVPSEIMKRLKVN